MATLLSAGSFIEEGKELEDDYSKEKCRLQTFYNYHGERSAIELARKGFYYEDSENKIECFCCHNSVPVVSLRQTRQTAESANSWHLPFCSWQHPSKNKPIYSRDTVYLHGADLQDHANRPHVPVDEKRIDRCIYDKPGSLEMAPTDSCPCYDCKQVINVPCCPYVPSHGYITFTRQGLANAAKAYIENSDTLVPRYRQTQDRVQSFETIQRHENLPPVINLAEAGFFYTGTFDSVRCFSCAGTLQNWQPIADPWREHARWFPWCLFLREEMGVRFIHRILQMTKEIREDHEDRQEKIDSNVVENLLLEGYCPVKIYETIKNFFSVTGYYPGYNTLREKLDE